MSTVGSQYQPPGKVPNESWYSCDASPICLRLLMHCVRFAASRADWTAGMISATRTPMMAMTTSSSMSVNPALERTTVLRDMEDPS